MSEAEHRRLSTLDFPANAQCGYLSVLEDRAKPRAPHPHLRDARTRRLGHAQARPDRVPVGRARRGRILRSGLHGRARHQCRARCYLRRSARHPPRRPLLDCREFEQYIYDGVSIPVRGGFDHRDRCRIGQGLPRPPGGHGSRPRGLQQHRERRRHRRAARGARHRQLECLRCLLRIETRADRAAQSPAGHPQRRARFGIAAQQQHRRDVVVGTRPARSRRSSPPAGHSPPAPRLTQPWRPTSRPR